jgi:hypothetical protein
MAGPWETLAGALRTVALADTGAGGLFQTGSPRITGIFNTQAPQGQAYPYVVMQAVSDVSDDTTTTQVADLRFEFAIFAARFSSTVVDVDTIAERLRTLFHRKNIASTGWSNIWLFRSNGFPLQFVDEVIQQNEEYRANFDRAK